MVQQTWECKLRYQGAGAVRDGGTRGSNVSGLSAGLLGLGPNKGRDWTGCVGLGPTS